MTQTEVERLADAARAAGRLGLDTEFMPEGRYRPLLCLVQVVVGDEVVILDPLAAPLDPAPLAEELLRYARGDVEHLLPLADEIQRRLVERGRLEWAREECVAIAEATDERDADEVWRRLPRVSGLDP